MRWRIKLTNKSKGPKEVYGGPYAEESSAIIAESRKKSPDYDKLIANWETISGGALAFIEKQKEGFETPVGEFVQNVIIDHPDEPEVPEIHLFASNEVVSEKEAAELGVEESKKAESKEADKSDSSDGKEEKDEFGL
jgi:hypothetical protein